VGCQLKVQFLKRGYLIARASFDARYQPFNDLTTPPKIDLL